MQKRNIRLIISSATICITAFAFSMSAEASDKAKITSTTTTNAITTLSNQESQAVSEAAGRVLFHTEHAQIAIADKKKEEAMKQIEQGVKLIKIIKNAVPKYKVSTQISSSGMIYTASDIVAQRYVVVTSSSFIEDVVTPVIQGKKSKTLHHKIVQAPEEDFSVSRRMTITLDTLLAGRMLNIAEAKLKAGKLVQAAKALREIQSHGVILNSVEVPLPLASAVDNLYLAQAEIAKKHYKNANVTLKEAANDLKAYEKITGDAHRKDINIITKKINKLTSSLDHQEDKNKIEALMKNSKSDIASWWSSVNSWVQKK